VEQAARTLRENQDTIDEGAVNETEATRVALRSAQAKRVMASRDREAISSVGLRSGD
jgi:hypothetical protein